MFKINFVQNNKIFLSITVVMIIVAVLAIAIWGLKLSLDFKGGTVFEYKLLTMPSDTEKIGDLTLKKIQKNGDNLKLYFDPLTEDQVKAVSEKIIELYPTSVMVSHETITSEVGLEQSRNALLSVLAASIGIIAFLSYAFREIPKPFTSWEFGLAAVLALMHDALLVVGAFAIIGHFWGAEIDALFITAILTVIGFSVHDTIVVFDRLRENLISKGSADYKNTVNDSLVETIGRSLSLTLTAVLVLVAMLYWGADSLRWFVLALLLGMISGTYSSIFVATQLLVIFQDVKLKYFPKRFKIK